MYVCMYVCMYVRACVCLIILNIKKKKKLHFLYLALF